MLHYFTGYIQHYTSSRVKKYILKGTNNLNLALHILHQHYNLKGFKERIKEKRSIYRYLFHLIYFV